MIHRRCRRGEGKTFDKILKVLKDEGYAPECLKSVTGYWSKVDVYRWEVILKINGIRHCCGCWYTMTQFLKEIKNTGFEIVDSEIRPKGN